MFTKFIVQNGLNKFRREFCSGLAMRHFILWRIIWREYLVYSLIFTLSGCIWVIEQGLAGVTYIFWLKLIGALAIVGYLWFWRMKYFYTFYNLGYGKRQIAAWSLGADLLISVIIFLFAFAIRPYFFNSIMS